MNPYACEFGFKPEQRQQDDDSVTLFFCAFKNIASYQFINGNKISRNVSTSRIFKGLALSLKRCSRCY